jgi:hypothetical protein
MVDGEAFAPQAMHSALVHAADRMSIALGSGVEQEALRAAVLLLDRDIAAFQFVEACRELTTAFGSLTDLPDVPATLPDRDGIRLILALTAQSIVPRLAR